MSWECKYLHDGFCTKRKLNCLPVSSGCIIPETCVLLSASQRNQSINIKSDTNRKMRYRKNR